MTAYMLRINDSALALVHIAAPWFEHAGARQITDLLVARITEAGVSGACSECQTLANSLHELFLSKGDNDALRQEYRAEPRAWYMAQCELLTALLHAGVVRSCNVGTINAFLFRRRDSELTPLNAPHTLALELEAGTIEQSSIAPFVSRSVEQLARQLLIASPELINRVSGMGRSEFVAALGASATRLIGYFPEAGRSGPGLYRREPPLAGSAELPSAVGDIVLFYLPTRKYLEPGQRKVLLSQMKRLVMNDSARAVGSSVRIERGWVVGAEVTREDCYGELLNYGELV